MNILTLCLGSYQVKDTTGFDADNFDRQLLYAVALSRLCEIAPSGTDIVVVENTTADIAALHQPLQAALKNSRITDVLFSQNNALGARNKGAGEYGMCQHALEKRKDLFEQADWVIYYTHRHTMPFPLVFNYIEKYQDFDAVVSRADYLQPSGGFLKAGQNIFDDVIFAMKKPVFLKYIESMNPELLVRKNIGSEQNLYNFLSEDRYHIRQVEHWGIFRYDYQQFQMQVI